MTIAQKEYLKKMTKVLAITAYVIAILIFIIIGAPNRTWCLWVGLGLIALPAVFVVFALIYVPIAMVIWHWRLMGECKTELEAIILERWWFWVRRSDTWADYLTEEIEEDDCDKAIKQMYLEFLHRLKNVKKPKWL